MVKVEFLGPIGIAPLEANITNINQLKEILQKDENLKSWIDISAIAVNEILIKDKNFSLKDGDVISLLPPVCGG
jgi:molybdopterin synthase sulfur carrier subunit